MATIPQHFEENLCANHSRMESILAIFFQIYPNPGFLVADFRLSSSNLLLIIMRFVEKLSAIHKMSLHCAFCTLLRS